VSLAALALTAAYAVRARRGDAVTVRPFLTREHTGAAQGWKAQPRGPDAVRVAGVNVTVSP
jgi:hypothetical protein